MSYISRLLGVGFIVCLAVHNTLFYLLVMCTFLRCSLVACRSFNFIHYDILYSKNIYLLLYFQKKGILSSDVNYESVNSYENLKGNSLSSVNSSSLGLKFLLLPLLNHP